LEHLYFHFTPTVLPDAESLKLK
jgi:hypothetical protein